MQNTTVINGHDLQKPVVVDSFWCPWVNVIQIIGRLHLFFSVGSTGIHVLRNRTSEFAKWESNLKTHDCPVTRIIMCRSDVLPLRYMQRKLVLIYSCTYLKSMIQMACLLLGSGY